VAILEAGLNGYGSEPLSLTGISTGYLMEKKSV
jgi:hypothetical protein